MQAPWPISRILAVITFILAVVLLFLSVLLPGAASHLILWTLVLVALLSFAVAVG
jgi:hypothetical protein